MRWPKVRGRHRVNDDYTARASMRRKGDRVGRMSGGVKPAAISSAPNSAAVRSRPCRIAMIWVSARNFHDCGQAGCRADRRRRGDALGPPGGC